MTQATFDISSIMSPIVAVSRRWQNIHLEHLTLTSHPYPLMMFLCWRASPSERASSHAVIRTAVSVSKDM
jgi:hypothetical protein